MVFNFEHRLVSNRFVLARPAVPVPCLKSMRRCPEALSFVPRNVGAVRAIMKMLPGYLEKADQFARTAALEKDAWLRAELEKQAAAYRKLASQRAKKYTCDLRTKILLYFFGPVEMRTDEIILGLISFSSSCASAAEIQPGLTQAVKSIALRMNQTTQSASSVEPFSRLAVWGGD
jgi:hypothetical protein